VSISSIIRRLKQAPRLPPRLFLVGALLAGLAAFTVYWGLHGTRWYQTLSAVYQLLGILIAFWQVLELRTQLGEDTVATLILRGLRPEVRETTVNVSAHAVVRWSVEGNLDVAVIDDNVPIETQVKELRGELSQLKNQLSKAAAELKAHKEATSAAVSEAHSKAGQQVEQLRKRLAEAVTSSPFVSIFGVWLVIVGTWMQLMVALFHV